MADKNFDDYRRDKSGISWKEYVDVRFNEQEKALVVATKELNRRLEGMNEIRSQLDRQASTFLTRDSFDSSHAVILEKLSTIEKSLSAEVARSKAFSIIVSASVSAAVAIIIAMIVYSITGRG